MVGERPIGPGAGIHPSKAPSRQRSGVSLTLALSGDLRGSLERGGGAITLSGSGVSLAYRDLRVTDARGRVLSARLMLRGDAVLIVADVARAAYPVRIDPLVQQAKLTAADGDRLGDLGFSVAASGPMVVVGAPGATVNGGSSQGAAYVFAESDGGWSQQAELTAQDGAASDRFGSSVSASGTTVVVGAPDATVNGGSYQGAAYVFTQSDGGWSQQAKLTAQDGAAYDAFASSVGVSGSTVVVGAPDAAVNGGSSQGAAYVFTQTDGGWSQQAKLTAPDGARSDQLGSSVGISGNTVVVGAPQAVLNGHPHQGAAYVFAQSDGAWTQQAKLTAQDGATSDNLGYSAAVSGSTVVVGAPGATVNGNSAQGAAYVFTQTDGGWSQQAKLTAQDGATGDGLGTSVLVSGTTVVAGAPLAKVNGDDFEGAAYMFAQGDGGWSQQAKLTAPDGTPADEIGFSVALSGTTVFAGAPQMNVDGHTNQGAAYVFALATSTTVTSSQNPSVFGQAVSFTATVAPAAAGPGVPTGTVTFMDGGVAIGRATLSGGHATVMSSALAVGDHTITASYQGDDNFNGSAGSLSDNPQGVNPADTASAVTSAQTPSVVAPSGSLTGSQNVSTEPPTAHVSSPADGATYRRGQVVAARYACADESDGPRIKSCTGTVANGSPIDTARPGTHTFTATAASDSGQNTTLTVHYTVAAPSKDFTVSRLRVRSNGTVEFDLTVSSAGQLDLLETHLKPPTGGGGHTRPSGSGPYQEAFAQRHMKVKRAGTSHITIAPSARSRDQLHHNRPARINLSITYQPARGRPATAVINLRVPN